MKFQKNEILKVMMGVCLGGFILINVSGVAFAASSFKDLKDINQEVRQKEALQTVEKEIVAQQEEKKKGKVIFASKGKEFNFKLKKIKTNKSVIFVKDELEKIFANYVGTDVSDLDLEKIIVEINKMYAKKGYLGARAFFLPQKIKNGVCTIMLVESKTDEVRVIGNKNTSEAYILRRLPIKKGRVVNFKLLNERLVEFNMSNDVQLVVDIAPGSKFGTTLFTIKAIEPRRCTGSAFIDNYGKQTTGYYRLGGSYRDASFSGRRDALTVINLNSKGNKTGFLQYIAPVDDHGSRFIMEVSGNKTKTKYGRGAELGLEGNSFQVDLRYENPFEVNRYHKLSYFLEVNRQSSTTSASELPVANSDIVDEKTREYTAGLEFVNYGKNAVFYQRHAVSHIEYDTKIYDGKDSFDRYTGDFIYRKVFSKKHNIIWKTHVGIVNTNNVHSAYAFDIGGMNNVRGYKNDLLSGDKGYYSTVEYSFDGMNDKDSSFVFVDWGKVLGIAVEGTSHLASLGLGYNIVAGPNLIMKVQWAKPLSENINGTDIGEGMVYFNCSYDF